MNIDPDRKAKRIAEDIAMMQSPERWPDFVLHLKTQPWHDLREYGYMNAGGLAVYRYDDGVDPETFSTIQELAERWSVD